MFTWELRYAYSGRVFTRSKKRYAQLRVTLILYKYITRKFAKIVSVITRSHGHIVRVRNRGSEILGQRIIQN